jgi:pimeloyl-ACP methyl ester carboxylesterase
MKKITLTVAALALCVLFSGCTIVALEAYSQAFGRVKELSARGEWLTYHFWSDINQASYPRQEVRFPSGKNSLQGFIYGAANTNGLVIISHGLGGTADGYFPMIMYFVNNGWRVFAYNNTGTAGSTGESIRGLTQSVIDLEAALKYVKSSSALNSLPVMLVGHSWGAYAATAVLNYNVKVNAVVSFAGYNNGRDAFRDIAVSSIGGETYTLFPQFWAIEQKLFGDAVNLTAVDGINRTRIPVMIVQSSDDDVISPKTIATYAYRSKLTNPNVDIVYLEGADAAGHEYVFCSQAQRAYMKAATASWEAYKAANRNPDKGQWAASYSGSGFDKNAANELNVTLMNRINAMFMSAR